MPYVFAQLAGSNEVNSNDPATVLRVILEGAQANPTNARPALGMRAFRCKLTDRQIVDLVTYL